MTPEEYEILFGEPPPPEETPPPPNVPVVEEAFSFNLTLEEPTPPPPQAQRDLPYEPVVIATASPTIHRSLDEFTSAWRPTVRDQILRKRVLLPAALIAALALGAIVANPTDRTTEVANEQTTTTVAALPSTASSAPTTATTIATQVLGEVAERALEEARVQLAEAEVVPEFAGFTEYNRESYTGGGWPDSDSDCQSNRHEVLIDESVVEPGLDEGGCQVISGLWIDPYDGMQYTDARLVTIDHVVPLAAAHRAGAWEWGEGRKRAFASEVDFDATLAGVGASVNQSKGDRGPDEWRPPLEAAWCRYAIDWIAIKDRWSLAFTNAEVAALNSMLSTCQPVSSNNANLADSSNTSG